MKPISYGSMLVSINFYYANSHFRQVESCNHVSGMAKIKSASVSKYENEF
jgi:hypothetical protein